MNDIIDIFKKLKTDFEFVTGYIYRGLVEAIGAGFASRLKEFVDKFAFIKKNAFVATADKDYLYLYASELLPHYPPKTADGLVSFYGEVGAIIPASTEIYDDNSTYKTISDVTISALTINDIVTVVDDIATVSVSNQLTNTEALVNGERKQITIVDGDTIQFEAGTLVTGNAVEIVVNQALVTARAQEAGEAENRALNSVLKIKKTIDGVNQDLGVVAITGGVEAEDVEDYRERVQFFLANPQSPFSEPHIVANIKDNLETIKFSWVEGGEFIDGEVTVVAMNYDYGLTAGELNDILTKTALIKPANLDVASMHATVATVSANNVTIADLLPASSGLQAEIKKNIEYFFNGDMYERDITKGNLEAIIYQTVNGAERVESFTLVDGQQTETVRTFWKLSNVVFQ